MLKIPRNFNPTKKSKTTIRIQRKWKRANVTENVDLIGEKRKVGIKNGWKLS